MKKLLPLVMLLMTASAANAGGLVTKHASSVQLTVDAARSTASRVGSSYAISGSGVNTLPMVQLLELFLQELSHLVYLLLAISLRHKLQMVTLSPSVNRLLKVMQFQLLLLLQVLCLTSLH